MNKNHISSNIKFLRESEGLSQGAFAELFKVTRDNIASYERGSEPRIAFLTDLVNYFHINFESLINNDLSSTNFKTKCAQILTLENGKEKGKEKGKKPNVHKSLPFDETNFKTKCAQKVINQNDNFIDNLNDTFPNVHKKLSSDSNIQNISFDDDNFTEVPIADISAAAGGGALNSDYYDVNGSLKLPKSMLSSGKHLCVKVDGYSMEPTLQHSSNIVIRHVDPSEWGRIKDGHIHVITDREGHTYIKRVENHLRERGAVVMRSDNSDKRRYASFELNEDELAQIWAVELYISSMFPEAYAEVNERLENVESDMLEMKTMLKTLVKRS